MRYHTMAANLPATRAARMPAGLLYTCISTGPRVPPSMDTPSLPATAHQGSGTAYKIKTLETEQHVHSAASHAATNKINAN